MSGRIRLSSAQLRLAIVWCAGAALIFVIVLAQTAAGKYGEKWQQAWGWFLPTVVPTLSVIMGAIVASSRDRDSTSVSRNVDRSLYRLVFILSVFYLLAVLSTLLLQPFSTLNPMDFVSGSSVWLGPIQAVVGIALGAFFTAKP